MMPRESSYLAFDAWAAVCRCAVCRLEFEQVDQVTLLPCKHYYHPQCVGEWLKHNKNCPVCSKEVVQGKST